MTFKWPSSIDQDSLADLPQVHGCSQRTIKSTTGCSISRTVVALPIITVIQFDRETPVSDDNPPEKIVIVSLIENSVIYKGNLTQLELYHLLTQFSRPLIQSYLCFYISLEYHLYSLWLQSTGNRRYRIQKKPQQTEVNLRQ